MTRHSATVCKILFLPLSLVYGAITGIRNRLYDMKMLKSYTCDVPVIVVGNITVGGTGKTPHVEYLAGLLRSTGKVAVLSRGYKRKSVGFLKAGPETPWTEIGDEPYQIKQKFKDVDVAVDSDRVRGIRQLIKENSENRVIIMDDGFQHRAVRPGLSILLIDYNRPLSGDFFLPAGRLRESSYEFRRANIILFTKCPQSLKPIDERIRVKTLDPFPYQQVFFTTLQYEKPVPLFGGPGQDPAEFALEKHSSALVVTGIANPDPLMEYVKKHIQSVTLVRFPDHYAFKQKDVEKINRLFEGLKGNKKIILTTEKDAVRFRSLEKCHFLNPDKWYFIPVSVRFLQHSEQKEFNKIILDYVEKDKGNSWLHI